MGGGAGKIQDKMDANTAKVERRKQEIAKEMDKYEEQMMEQQRPLKERALAAYSEAGKSKKELGDIEVMQAKATSGVLQNYQNRTNENYQQKQQGLFTVLNNPMFDPQTSARITSRMSALQSLFEE